MNRSRLPTLLPAVLLLASAGALGACDDDPAEEAAEEMEDAAEEAGDAVEDLEE